MRMSIQLFFRGNNQQYQISPRWIHNLCKSKESENGGAGESAVMALLKKQGAPYWSEFSGETTEYNFKRDSTGMKVYGRYSKVRKVKIQK